jgi:molybdopterin converting factor small subunit
MKKTVHLNYFAQIRNDRGGLSCETIETDTTTALALFNELKKKYKFTLSAKNLKVVINEEFSPWSTQIKSKDRIVFIPPVSGG